MAEEAYDKAVARLEVRISNLASENWEYPDANRLAKRLSKHGYELLTFLWHSDRSALTQSVLMSVLCTLRVRGHQPLDTILSLLVDYSKLGKLPSLPPKSQH